MTGVDLSGHQEITRPFSFQGSDFKVQLPFKSSPECSLHAANPSQIFPGNIWFQLFLFEKLGDTLVPVAQSSSTSHAFYKDRLGRGVPWENDAAPTISTKHVLKVKVWLEKTFASFKVFKHPTCARKDLSLWPTMNMFCKKPGHYFRISKVGPDAGAIDMLQEWDHTDDIQQLNGMSPSILDDLERAYKASKTDGIAPLCTSIENYLLYLVNERNVGEIYDIAKRMQILLPFEQAYVNTAEDFKADEGTSLNNVNNIQYMMQSRSLPMN